MISVAMTTYNGEKYIERQLVSIIKQTLLPDEVIIVDDCSTDHTVEIVKNFIKDNSLSNSWRLIRLEENKGFIESFYVSITNTTGELIFLCDQDDIWLPDKIELMSKRMKENPSILALASRFQKIDSYDDEIHNRTNPISSNNNLIRKRIKPDSCVRLSIKEILTYNISPGCTSAFRAQVISDFIKLNKESNKLPHDWKINIIAAMREGLYYLNITTTNYRLHDSNTLGLKKSINLYDRINVINKLQTEREAMLNIIKDFKELEVSNNSIFIESKKYAERMCEVMCIRKEALMNKKLHQSVKLLFYKDVIRFRLFESILVDCFSILKTKLKIKISE